MSRFCSVMTCTSPSVVRPTLVRRRDGGALVLHRNATQGIVLALRMTWPVVRNEDSGQRGVSVELDAEHVPGLALVPVVGRVDLTAGRCELGNGDRSADRGELVAHGGSRGRHQGRRVSAGAGRQRSQPSGDVDVGYL